MIKYPQTTQDEDWGKLSNNGINAASVEEWNRTVLDTDAFDNFVEVCEEARTQARDTADCVKVTSDGGSTSYYELPEGATELQDLIEHKRMNYAVANMFKACYRLGQKEGNDDMYDLEKIQWFVNREIERREE